MQQPPTRSIDSADKLAQFLRNRGQGMRMSHIYQPVLIRALVDAGGTATIRQLALELLRHDESEIRYYEDKLKKMPLPVLKRRGVISRDGDLVRLNVPPLSFEEQVEIRMLCEQRMHEFMKSRGIAIWDYRMLETEPVEESIRYEVLKASAGQCSLCGRSKDDDVLEVDHIVPRSKGGSNDIDNLQVLCRTCNRGKSNRDETDFR